MTHLALRLALGASLCLAALDAAADGTEANASEAAVKPDEAAKPEAAAKPDETAKPAPALHWRKDPAVKRHPGSYLGGAMGYTQSRAWIPANESHGNLELGPVHTWGMGLRVGDAFAEWFALGIQLQISGGKADTTQISALDLLLDVTFYPWGGLGVRPSLGIGFGYAQGEHKWEMGGGGPGCLALALLYEIRITRLFTIAPVAQISWIAGEQFDGLFFFAGIEFIKWFKTATG